MGQLLLLFLSQHQTSGPKLNNLEKHTAIIIGHCYINKMYKFGPYGPNHSTAATFAFRRELLKETRFEDNAAVAEERHFLKGYTVPFVQLDPMKSILVFSHDHNSFDKKHLLENPNQCMSVSDKKVEDFVKEEDCLFRLQSI